MACDAGAKVSRLLQSYGAADLPFVRECDGSVSFWATEPRDNTERDIELGCGYARLALAAAKTANDPALLAFVLGDIVRAGVITGLEAGFLMTIASAAKNGSMQ